MMRSWTQATALLLLLTATLPAECQDAGALQRKGRAPIEFGANNIIGGANAKSSAKAVGNTIEAPQYNYVVGISYRSNGRDAICTGTLLSDDLVLTAGHCACGDRGSYRVTQELNMSSGNFITVAEDPVLMDPRTCLRQAIIPGYDLALLKLANKAVVDSRFRPNFRLASELDNQVKYGRRLTVVGYGLTEKKSWGVRLEAKVQVYSAKCLQLSLIYGGCAPFLEMVLADTWAPVGKRSDTCGGDSGGPVFSIEETSKELNLVAATSRAAPLTQPDGDAHCGGGGIYTVLGRLDVRAWLVLHGLKYLDPD
jgi:V8-like Glu-specific endopeptidase